MTEPQTFTFADDGAVPNSKLQKLPEATLQEMESLWQESKQQERT